MTVREMITHITSFLRELENSMSYSTTFVSAKSAKFDTDMSYPTLDLVVPGKSIKLAEKKPKSKAKKEQSTAATGNEESKPSYEKSSKTGKEKVKVSPRSIDPSAPSNDSVFYATAIDFTRMVDPSIEAATAEETSAGFITMYGFITMGVSFVAASCLY